MAESLQYPLFCPYIITYIVTSKRGSPEEVLVPMMFTASSMRRLSRRKRSQLQWRTPTPPSLQREHCVEDPSCKHGSFFPTSSLTSSCSPNLCRRSKWGSLGKGGRTWMVTGQQTFILQLKTHLRNHASFPGQKSLSLFHSSAAW